MKRQIGNSGCGPIIAILLFCILLVMCSSPALAETFVRSAPSVEQSTQWSWQTKEAAVAVQTQTGWKLLTNVLMNERIYVCKDSTAAAVGNQAICETRWRLTPTRDNWALKSEIYATPVLVSNKWDHTITWKNPTQRTDGSALPPSEIASINVYLLRYTCNPSNAGCAAEGPYEGPIRLPASATSYKIEDVQYRVVFHLQAEDTEGSMGPYDTQTIDPPVPTVKAPPDKVTDVKVESVRRTN
jgi:hypothetical protein